MSMQDSSEVHKDTSIGLLDEWMEGWMIILSQWDKLLWVRKIIVAMLALYLQHMVCATGGEGQQE